MIAGVCNGIAAYLNIDPTLVRLAFVLLTMLWGTGLLVYLVMVDSSCPRRGRRKKRRRRPAPHRRRRNSSGARKKAITRR